MYCWQLHLMQSLLALMYGLLCRHASLQKMKVWKSKPTQLSIMLLKKSRVRWKVCLNLRYRRKIVANVEIREVYKFDKATVAGCYVIDGKISRNSKDSRYSAMVLLYIQTGRCMRRTWVSLKRFKDDVKEVHSGMECGLTVKNYNDIKVGDIIEAYEEEEVKRTL